MADITSTFNSLSSTESSNSPAGTATIGAGLDDNLRMVQSHIAAWRDLTGWGGILLSSVAGTNTITATIATAGSVTFGPTSLASGQRFILIPANTNTGATTLNITSPNGGSSLTAKNVFSNGAACVGGELVANCAYELLYDGTQFNIIGSPMTRYKVGSLTRDTTAASGSVAYTGVGFKPKAIIIVGGLASDASNGSVGFSDATTHICLYNNYYNTANAWQINTGLAVAINTAAGASQTATVASFDTDGFTLSWAKGGSPTGTATLGYLAFR